MRWLEELTKFPFGGVSDKQGDTISPKLFTNVLEDVFKTLDWKNAGININGEFLSHLRFGDDIVVFAESPETLQRMVSELNTVCETIGLKVNVGKTKVMTNQPTLLPITINTHDLELVNEYIYLGETITCKKNMQIAEVKLRVRMGWAAYSNLKHIFKSNMPQHLKTRAYDQCVLPTMTYGCETWTLTEAAVTKLKVAQRAMERSMVGIPLEDRKRNTWIREQTKLVDITDRVSNNL